MRYRPICFSGSSAYPPAPIFRKENTDKALKYGIYRHLPTYEKIIRNLVSFYVKQNSPRNSQLTTLGSMFQIEEKCHVQYDPESRGDRSCKTDIGETGIRLDTHVISEGKTDT